MRRLVVWSLVLAVLAGAGIAAWMWTTQPTKQLAPRTSPVTRGSVERTVLATGVIEAAALVSVGAEVSGRIKALNVALGDSVMEGDVIAEIDALNQENAVKAAEAALANTKAQERMQEASLAQARTALTRSEQLQAQQLVSDADYQAAQLAVTNAEAQKDALAAQVQQAELNVDSAKLDLSRTVIVAPASGTIVSLEVGVGQTVNASNSTPTIVKIAELDNMVVKAEISEADVPRVKAGQKVYFTILGAPNRPIEATLRTVEPAPESIADSAGATASTSGAVYYNGLFDVANPDHMLRISMTAQVTIVLEAVDNVLTVPSTALTRAGRADYSLKVWNAQLGTSEERKVEVGLNNNVVAEIKSGVNEGEVVVLPTPAAGGNANSGGNAGGGARVFFGGGGPPL
ncbi:MAG: efflux RND transporter periplasmic adaptor subunit [Devosia sp.]